MSACPHCGGVVGQHVCEDTGRWTDAERDELRVILRDRHPGLQFAPSTQHLAARFGHKSQRESS